MKIRRNQAPAEMKKGIRGAGGGEKEGGGGNNAESFQKIPMYWPSAIRPIRSVLFTERQRETETERKRRSSHRSSVRRRPERHRLMKVIE